MRVYSPRERILFAVGLLLSLVVATGVAMIMATQPGAVSDVWLWAAGFGGLGGAFVCLKVIITGRATPYLEQDVRDVFGFPHRPDSGDRGP